MMRDKFHLSKAAALVIWAIICLLLCSALYLILLGTVSAASLDQATATPRQFCHVQYLVFVRPDIKGVNVRPTPSKNTTPYFTVNGTANPQSAVALQDGWFELCSISQREYMVNDPALVTYASVTPGATPTRLGEAQTQIAIMTAAAATNTPRASATSTPTLVPFKALRVCIDYIDSTNNEPVNICSLFPLNSKISVEETDREPK